MVTYFVDKKEPPPPPQLQRAATPTQVGAGGSSGETVGAEHWHRAAAEECSLAGLTVGRDTSRVDDHDDHDEENKQVPVISVAAAAIAAGDEADVGLAAGSPPPPPPSSAGDGERRPSNTV